MFSQRTSDILAAILILLFMYTGLSKLIDNDVFKSGLIHSPWQLLVSNASWIAISLPIGEIIIAIILLIPNPKIRIVGYLTSSMLLFSFVIYLVFWLSTGKHLPCSCGGIIKYLNWTQHVYFNLVFIIMSLWGALICNKLIRQNLSSQTERQIAL